MSQNTRIHHVKFSIFEEKFHKERIHHLKLKFLTQKFYKSRIHHQSLINHFKQLKSQIFQSMDFGVKLISHWKVPNTKQEYILLLSEGFMTISNHCFLWVYLYEYEKIFLSSVVNLHVS